MYQARKVHASSVDLPWRLDVRPALGDGFLPVLHWGLLTILELALPLREQKSKILHEEDLALMTSCVTE